jgi:peptide chain release factor 3
MRNIPIIVFINKLDREGKDAFDLLDELEKKLGLVTVPLSFPIGMGYDFQGIYNLWNENIRLFEGEQKTTISQSNLIEHIDNPELETAIGSSAKETLLEELELVREVYPSFDREAYLNGEQHPVFFGSALNNFGVQELLDCFVDIAPPPMSKDSEERTIAPDEKYFSGFVFKIHANMDPKHRDRLAFIKIVSGTFARNVPYLHVRQKKKLKFSSPNAFFADKKEIVDISYPGDIVGLHDTGNFKIGDTLTSGEQIHFKGIPSFSPEHFRYINNADPMKAKQLNKGVDQLMDEGVAQLFTLELNGRKVVGTVGALQFDVIQYRLEHEYGASCTYENLNVHKACWIEVNEGGEADFTEFKQTKSKFLAKDKQGQLVYLADSAFSLQMTQSKYPKVLFHATSEF